MRVTKARAQKRPLFIFDSRVLVGFSGILLSVVLHELFHVVMHWGHIVNVSFFTGNGAILAIESITPIGYDVQLEEAIAYSITLLTILMTLVVMWKLHDKKDTRSARETLGVGHSRDLMKLLS